MEASRLRICVIGCGYVGLVTGACFAEIGHEVVCTDNDAEKICILNQGGLPIYEPHLDEIVRDAVRQGRLSFTADVAEAVRFGDSVFVCVGTPPLPDGDADLSAIDHVARLIATESRSPKLVVEKSTVPIQTGQHVRRALSIYGRKRGFQFTVASNPEFLREGTAVLDFLHPDRIVIGSEDEQSEARLREIYRPITEQSFSCRVHGAACHSNAKPKLLVTSINSAELIKHACNSFLAVKISYANLIADMCERMGADIDEVTQALGSDPRIGRHFLNPGLGFGGFCLPKDIQAFIHLGERAGIDTSMLKSAEAINKQRIDNFLQKIRTFLWVLKGKHVGVLGLAFKPNTDDIRFAPAIDLIKRLLAEGVQVRAYDPQAMEKVGSALPGVQLCHSGEEVADGAEALIIATEWPEFKQLDWAAIRDRMLRPLVLDGRNLLDPATMAALGFEYNSVGRGGNESKRSAAAKSVVTTAGLRG